MGQAAAKIPTWNWHKHGPDCHLQPGLDVTPLPCVSHTDAGTTSADATDFYTRTARTFTAALSTDIYSAICTSSAADPWTGYTAKHAATATLASDVSATAANAAAASNSTTAIYKVTAGNTAAATPSANTNTSANTAAAAAHTDPQSTNITAAHVAEHLFNTAACHVTICDNARH